MSSSHNNYAPLPHEDLVARITVLVILLGDMFRAGVTPHDPLIYLGRYLLKYAPMDDAVAAIYVLMTHAGYTFFEMEGQSFMYEIIASLEMHCGRKAGDDPVGQLVGLQWSTLRRNELIYCYAKITAIRDLLQEWKKMQMIVRQAHHTRLAIPS